MYWVHANLKDLAFSSFLSLELSAQSLGRKVTICLNTNGTTGYVILDYFGISVSFKALKFRNIYDH